jgi:hypothetical protein
MTRRNDYSAFFPLTGWGAKYRKVIEDYTKAFCQRRSRVYREVINDAIILALDAERTYDEAKGDPKTWLLQCLKGLGRRTQFLGLHGESTAGAERDCSAVSTEQHRPDICARKAVHCGFAVTAETR